MRICVVMFIGKTNTQASLQGLSRYTAYPTNTKKQNPASSELVFIVEYFINTVLPFLNQKYVVKRSQKYMFTPLDMKRLLSMKVKISFCNPGLHHHVRAEKNLEYMFYMCMFFPEFACKTLPDTQDIVYKSCHIIDVDTVCAYDYTSEGMILISKCNET